MVISSDYSNGADCILVLRKRSKDRIAETIFNASDEWQNSHQHSIKY